MGLVTPVDPVPLSELGRVHFAGIGGAGMSGIARIMLARGVPVSGSDAASSEQLGQLAALGARVHLGHAAAHLAGADTLVVSTAIRPDNPELAAARSSGIRILHRGAALASIMLGRPGIAVAGTHGKTTTTSMITTVLRHCGAAPSYLIGGVLAETGLGAEQGAGQVFVAEADESDGSFLMLSPDAAVITCIEADHLDNWGSLASIEEGFAAFARKISPGGLLVTCADDAGARALAAAAANLPVRRVSYGESADADYRVSGVLSRGMATVLTLTGPASSAERHGWPSTAAVTAVDGQPCRSAPGEGPAQIGISASPTPTASSEPTATPVPAAPARAPRIEVAAEAGGAARVGVTGGAGGAGDAAGAGAAAEAGVATGDGDAGTGVAARAEATFEIAVPGRHNALNAAAAFATAVELGYPADRVAAGLAAYRGARRRMELVGEADDVRVLDSYGHHPTEIAADLTAAREVAAIGRVIAIFQPHLYSRTKIFAGQFGAALGLADEVLVLDVYAAREDPAPGVTGKLVADEVPGGRARFVADRAEVPPVIAGLAKPGDLVLTMGAGDVTELGPLVLAALRDRSGAAG